MSSTHRAAILSAPGQPLSVQDVATHHPLPNEVLIRNYCIAIQPLDAKILISAYGPASSLIYPAILGSSGAGLVEEVGSDVTNLQVGDRVVFDTKAYVDVGGEVNRRQGTWQQLVISRADTVAKIGDTPFPQAVLKNFPFQTAVAALQVFLGMTKPAINPNPALRGERVLIWGAGGAVGSYAVQYAVSVGHTVVATASPHSTTSLVQLGASEVVDYKAPDILQKLRELGPYRYMFTASGDALSQSTISSLLQPTGGRFASVLPPSIESPANVEIIYTAFSQAAQKEEHLEWRDWWYKTYLPTVLSDPVKYTMADGGLEALQKASQDVFDGKVRGKLVVEIQE